jgi:hypothetical protein
VLIMPDYAWVELDGDLWRELWRDFVDDFGFSRSRTPVINEPVPSVVWALPDLRESARPVAQLVNDVLRECVEYWDSSHYPSRDYMIFVARDHSFGVIGDHIENTTCFFGAPAVTAALALNDAPVAMLRRMCRPVPFTEDVAEAVGRLLALAGTSDVVDAAVVIAAVSHNCAVLTSDPGDLGKLADAVGVQIPLITV